MKGLIIYSSKTGNTKRMAEYLYDSLKKVGEFTLCEIGSHVDVTQMDVAFVGGWIDKGTFEKKTLDFLKEHSFKKLGFFATLGADPQSKHGCDVKKTLEKCLKEQNTIELGVYLCPGLVDPKLKENLKRIPEHVLPKHIVDQMLEASETSRMATEEELQEAGEYFKKQLEK